MIGRSQPHGNERYAAATRAFPRLHPRLLSLLVSVWFSFLATVAVISAYAIVSAPSMWSRVAGNAVTPESEWAGISVNLWAIGVAMAISVAIGLYKPRWWRRALVAMTLLPVPMLLITSHRASAGGALLAMVVPTFWLGRQLAGVLLRGVDRFTAWVIGSAFGLAALAFLGFGLGSFGLLRPQVVWPVLLIALVGLLIGAANPLRADIAALNRWMRRSVGRELARFALTGVAIAFGWLNLIGALAPENSTDATWQRLVTALRFAQRGDLTTGDPDLFVANHPAAGEMIYAVGMVIGPVSTAKLLHFLAGLCCMAAVFALGRRLGGAPSGRLAAFALYTMPLVAWLSQIGFLDLFVTLFALVAALIIVRRERSGAGVALASGICLGLGVAVKPQFGYVAVGLAVVLGLVALRRGTFIQAAQLVARTGAVALLVALPWLLRSILLTGGIPGLSLASQSMLRKQGDDLATLGDLTSFGIGRSPLDLLRVPFDLTLRSYYFEVNPTPSGPFGGMIGYLLLGTVPLILMARPPRRVVALLIGAASALLLWFYTAQYLRYALPILALLCPVGGFAFVALRRRLARTPAAAIMKVALLVLIVAGVSIQLRVPAFGWSFALGRESEAAHLSKYIVCCSGYTVLELLEREPSATRVLSTAGSARLYTRARITTLPVSRTDLDLMADEETLLTQLRAGGYSHIIIGWQGKLSGWEKMTLVSEDFLRRNTILLGGDARASLYRLLPPAERGAISWAAGDELIANGSFETTDGAGPAGWTPVGQVTYDRSNRANRGGTAAVRIAPGSSLAATLPTVPGARYLLSHFTRGVADDAAAEGVKAQARFEWRDASGKVIGVSSQAVWVRPDAYHQFSMLATAPPDAVAMTVSLQSLEGAVWFDDVSLRAVARDGNAARSSLAPVPIP